MSEEGIGADPFENGWAPGNDVKLHRVKILEQAAEIERLQGMLFGDLTKGEIAAAAKAMEAKRLELIAQPIARIYPQLAEAAIKAATAVRKATSND